MENETKRNVLTVTELTRRIKTTMEGTYPSIEVEGEISNLSRPASGHLYFTIKDENAQISAVLFKGSQRTLRFSPADGMLVRATGGITVYAKRGNYQILVRSLQEGGQGSLQAQFEALKKKLSSEGLFDAERKQPLPMLPQHVGVVTSATGAAIKDILNVVSRRFPNLHLLLAPVSVQGDGAAQEIAAAIDRLNAIGGLDVLIVGRGGGSLEDLWAFNEEVVARAIARSAIPVISAVGHEIDFTISDFVADLRAPTPSAAAELVVGCKEEFQTRLEDFQRRLQMILQRRLEATRHRLERASGSYVFREPANVVRHHRQRLEGMSLALRHHLRDALRTRQQTLDWIEGRLHQRTRFAMQEGRQVLRASGERMGYGLKLAHQTHLQNVKRLSMQLRALNPLAVLQRGYSVTRLPDGRILNRATQVEKGTELLTLLAQGKVRSTVSGIDLKGNPVEQNQPTSPLVGEHENTSKP